MNGRTLQHESEYVHQLGRRRSMQSVKLISIATAVPPHAIEQGDAATATHHCFGGRVSDFNRLARVSAPTTRSVREVPEDLMAPWIAAMAAALLAVQLPLDRGR
jgi:hypothetical protein